MSQFGYFENRKPLKAVPGGCAALQATFVHGCVCEEYTEPGLRLSFFSVVFVSKGGLLDIHS